MSSRDPIPTIRQRLSSARVELALAGIMRAVALALWQWLLLAAVVVAFDALWPVGPFMRFMLALVLLTGLVRIIWCFIPPRLLRRASPLRLAREIEQRCSLVHNPLITAVQLQVPPSVAGPGDIKSLLLARSAERGEAAARATESSQIADRGVRSHSLLALLAGLVFICTAGFIARRPIDAVTMRLIDPWGDHPPYTPLVFDITFEPTTSHIVYGDNARCTARITAGAVPHAELIVRDPLDKAAEPMRLPLVRVESADSPQLFSATLRDCRAPMQVMVHTPAGRSEWSTIVPLQVPRWASRTLTIRGPLYAPSQQPCRLPLSDRPEALRVLQGSRFTLEVTSTLPLNAMRADVSESQLPTLSDDRRSATCSWDAATIGSHEFEFALVGPTDLPSTLMRLRIEVVPDRPPDISISQPPPHAAALPDQQFMARLDALDDVSIQGMTLTSSVLRNGEVVDESVQTVNALEPTGGRATSGVQVDLSQFDLQPGDTVRLQAIARDDRPDELGGPQASQPAACDLLIIDEETYTALAGRSVGAAQQGQQGDLSADASGASGASRDDAQPSDRQADGADGEPGEGGADIASAGQSGEHFDGKTPGNQPSHGMPGQAAGQGSSPAPGGGASDPTPGSAARSADAQTTGNELLDQAQSRPLITRDGAVQPVSGRTDPDSPRRHLTATDDGSAPPALAPSRSTTSKQENTSGDVANPLTAIPARYRDLAARYFRRLAQDDAAQTQEENRDHE